MASSATLYTYTPKLPTIGALSLLLVASLVVVLPPGETVPIALADGAASQDEPVGNKFGDCPLPADCNQIPYGGPLGYPDVVTGHTTFGVWIVEKFLDPESGSAFGPSGLAAPEPTYPFPDVQRECVVWLNGNNLDQRPGQGDNEPGWIHFPSDEAFAQEDNAMQDYSFNRDAAGCGPRWLTPDLDDGSLGLPTDFAAASGYFSSTEFEASYAIAVEKKDCHPVASGQDFRFRGHLDFVDPNGVYHEVQEYDYDCPDVVGVPVISPPVAEVFPWNQEDPHNTQGCSRTDWLQSDDEWGHKCNGSVQDADALKLWITRFHEPVYERSVEWGYNFALQVDMCAGINVYEADGKAALGYENRFRDANRLPQGDATRLLLTYHDLVYHVYYGVGVDEFVAGWPSADVCTDGSSFSMNDNPRDRILHTGYPQGEGDEEIMRGNSLDFDQDSPTFGKHRSDCRSNEMDWPMSSVPDLDSIAENCYPEDHKTAELDMYAYSDGDHPLFEAFEGRSNGRTGIASA